MGKRVLLGNVKGPQGDKGDKGDPGPKGPRGSRWATGTAINGTITTPTSYSTGIADSTVNDHYFNPKTGHIYRCYVAGDETTAKWVWVGNLSSLNGTETVFINKDILDTFKPLPFFTNNTLNATAYGDNMFIAVGDAGTILYSSDGFEWTEITIAGVEKFTAAIYGNKTFIISGKKSNKSCIYYSFDGVNWTEASGDHTSQNISLDVLGFGDNGVFVVAGNDHIFYSITGYNGWTEAVISKECDSITSAMTGLMPIDVAYGNGKFVMICTIVSASMGYQNYLCVSIDGINWSFKKMLNNNYVNYYMSGITFDQSNFVVVGYNPFVTTNTSIIILFNNFDDFKITLNDYFGKWFKKIIHTEKFFISSFTTKNAAPYTTNIVYSEDGFTWNSINTFDSTDGICIRDMSFGNGLCIAVGNSGVMYYSSLADVKMLNDVVNSLINEDSELADQIKSLQTQLSADISSLSTDMSKVKEVLDKHYYATDEKIVGKLSDGSTLYEKTFIDIHANADSYLGYDENPLYFYRSTETNSVDLSNLNISKMISVEGTLETVSGNICRIGDISNTYFGDCGNGPATQVYNFQYSQFIMSKTSIKVRLYQDKLSSCNFTIRYTKTTG